MTHTLYVIGSDYTAVSFQGAFRVGATNGDDVCVDVFITNNRAYEKTESFFLTVTSERNVQISDPTVYVSITDDEGTNKINVEWTGNEPRS